jgi:hypothetical protein
VNKRYVGKFSDMSFPHKKTGTMVYRHYIVVPHEVLEDKKCKLRMNEEVIITVTEEGKIVVEPL